MNSDMSNITEKGPTAHMSASRRAADAVDQLDQHVDELKCVWLALGNAVDLPEGDLLDPVRETINGIVRRLEMTRARVATEERPS